MFLMYHFTFIYLRGTLKNILKKKNKNNFEVIFIYFLYNLSFLL
jgi:hypothetical protein